ASFCMNGWASGVTGLAARYACPMPNTPAFQEPIKLIALNNKTEAFVIGECNNYRNAVENIVRKRNIFRLTR
ncbi:hypothetical protein, partial [Burkholderia ubonensis]|uniref:hypothetical protein n=1 Tax=Burkholderia ubonensis TaxID=101571 RepID=UPI001E64DE1E